MGTSGLDHLLSRYTVALEADPDNPKLRVEVAEILEELDRGHESVEQYAAAARLYVNLGLFQEAAATCQRVINLDRDHGEANRILQGLRRRGLVDATPAPEPLLPPAAPLSHGGRPQQIVVLDDSTLPTDATIEKQLPADDAPRPPVATSTADLVVGKPPGPPPPGPPSAGGGSAVSDDNAENIGAKLRASADPLAAAAPSAAARSASANAPPPPPPGASPPVRAARPPSAQTPRVAPAAAAATAAPAAAAATAAADEGRAAASAKLDPRRRSAAAASSGAAASGRAARRRSRRSAYDATVAAGSGTHTPADEQQVPTAPASAVARAAESGSIETKPVDGSARMREPSGESPIKASATASRPLLEPHIGLFQRLPPNIAATGLQQSYQKGQSIARRGERCDALLLITEGSVALTTKSVSGEVVDLGQLDAGSFFGELGVLGSGAHILDARAASDTTVLTIPKGQMRKVLKEDPDINRLVRSAYRDRLQSIVLKTSNLFSTLHDRVGRRLLKTFKPVRAKPGTRLVQEGGEAPGLFLVLVGSLRVTAKGKDGSDVELATLGHGEFFGEISLLRSRPCCADVTAINFCQLLHLAPADFHAFAEQRPSFKAGLDKEARARERENQQKLG